MTKTTMVKKDDDDDADDDADDADEDNGANDADDDDDDDQLWEVQWEIVGCLKEVIDRQKVVLDD